MLEVVGVSVDSAYTHLAWKNTPVDQGGIGPIGYPLVSDLKKDISRDFGVLMKDGVALRGLFLIDREGIIRHAVLNDLPLVGETRSVGLLGAIYYFTATPIYQANAQLLIQQSGPDVWSPTMTAEGNRSKITL